MGFAMSESKMKEVNRVKRKSNEWARSIADKNRVSMRKEDYWIAQMVLFSFTPRRTTLAGVISDPLVWANAFGESAELCTCTRIWSYKYWFHRNMILLEKFDIKSYNFNELFHEEFKKSDLVGVLYNYNESKERKFYDCRIFTRINKRCEKVNKSNYRKQIASGNNKLVSFLNLIFWKKFRNSKNFKEIITRRLTRSCSNVFIYCWRRMFWSLSCERKVSISFCCIFSLDFDSCE